MMLVHTAPDHDGPSTSKLIPLQSTSLGVMLISSTINANPVWSSDGGFVPISDVVAGDVRQVLTRQEAYKLSGQPLLAYCGQSEH